MRGSSIVNQKLATKAEREEAKLPICIMGEKKTKKKRLKTECFKVWFWVQPYSTYYQPEDEDKQ